MIRLVDHIKRGGKIAFFAVFVLIFGGLNAYFFHKYAIADPHLERISISMNFQSYEPLIHPASNDEVVYENPIYAKVNQGTFVFTFPGGKIRNFKLYTGQRTDTGFVKEIVFYTKSGEKKMAISEFKTVGITKTLETQNELRFVGESSAYFQLRREQITSTEAMIAQIIMFILALMLSAVIVVLYFGYLFPAFGVVNIQIVVASLFLASFFLPIPYSNIIVLASLALSLWSFNWRRFVENKVGLLLMLYFIYFMINNLFISREFNGKLFETLLPFFFLPVYFACIPKANYLRVIVASALLFSLYFISTSLIDLSIYRTLTCFSFDAFTKHVHPVYFSYLLVFAIFYLWIETPSSEVRILIYGIVFFSLLCCGSKLMIALSAIFYFIQFSKKRLIMGLAFTVVMIVMILVFAPTRKRFKEVFNFESLSVLKEDPIRSRFDQRLNGLTLRLIIWDETIGSLKTAQDIVFGKGVDAEADKFLEQGLARRGVEPNHTKYDPHNQFIASYYKMGLVGLGILLLICVSSFYQAWRWHKPLLLYSSVLLVTAMCTESVWQRIIGIYFFISILLLQTSVINEPKLNFENSDTGNQGNPE